MNTFFSSSTLKSVTEHLPEKLIASAGVSGVVSALGIHVQLLGVFFLLELLDVLTRWIALSAQLWKDMYPQTPGTVWQYMKFIYQGHRWRRINSEAMRNQFISKISTYCIILLFTSLCDLAMRIAGGPAISALLPIVTAVLCCTELLSCLENLAEAGVNVAGELIAIVKARKERIK